MKNVFTDLQRIREEHPEIVISINTHHALNILYNITKHAINQMRSRGVLDVDDCDLLEQSLKNMYVHLRIPSSKPPARPLIVTRHIASLRASR